MFRALLFVHVVSALLLGSFVVFPFVVRRIAVISDKERPGLIAALIGFTRVGHYALVLLLLSGGGLIASSANRPPASWIVIAVLVLLVIGACIGMLSRRLKRLLEPETIAGDSVTLVVRRLTVLSWVTAVSIVCAIAVMIRR